MRAILENLRSGEISVTEIPQPELRAGGILVRTAYSAISAGTERAKIEISEKSLLRKALTRPDLARQVVDFARKNGVRAAYGRVQAKLDTLSAMGYSCSGEVIAVGDGVTEFRVGDRVACAGAGYANHAEVNWVPPNLAVRVPDSVAMDAASLSTIGAIAVQGLRQAEVALGETVLVIGAGLVGVLTIQLARAAGCRVIAVDRDSRRVEQARVLGANLALDSGGAELETAIREFSRYGADAAIITAATHSSEPLDLAAQMLRDRGRIVVVGDVGMDVSRSNMYQKELKLVMSRSYGPGRYDAKYEEGGHDYPIGYVRWTENRNMESFLDLLSSGAINASALLERRFPISEAGSAYEELRSGAGYTAIIEYPRQNEQRRAPQFVPSVRLSPGRLRIGCIGAGDFARSEMFPILRKADVCLEAVASASGIAAESARAKFGFHSARTADEIVQDPNLDAVFVATRNQSHSRYVCAALEQDKALFVEKPLAVNRAQLYEIRRCYNESLQRGRRPFLMVGFNRRFAPATRMIREFFAQRHEPMMLHVRVNAGYLSSEHWTQDPAEGGRIIGELCHFVDWAQYTVGVPIRSVSASALPNGARYHDDNLAITLIFDDGSIANLLYLANGDPAIPKEYFEIFCEGSVARMEDFRTLELVRNRTAKRLKIARDKGHHEEFLTTLKAMRSGEGAPISFEDLVHVTEATFAIRDALATGTAVSVKAADLTEFAPVLEEMATKQESAS